MKYNFLIVKVKVRYPACLTPMQNNIWKQYIEGLARNEGKQLVLNQAGEFEKIYNAFKLIKPPPSTKVQCDGKDMIETFVYYFVKCKYDKNQLVAREIEYSVLPEQNTKYIKGA